MQIILLAANMDVCFTRLTQKIIVIDWKFIVVKRERDKADYKFKSVNPAKTAPG